MKITSKLVKNPSILLQSKGSQSFNYGSRDFSCVYSRFMCLSENDTYTLSIWENFEGRDIFQGKITKDEFIRLMKIQNESKTILKEIEVNRYFE